MLEHTSAPDLGTWLADLHLGLGLIDGLLAAFEAPVGGSHHLFGLPVGQILTVNGSAKHRRILGIGQRGLGLLQLSPRHGAGIHQRSEPDDGRLGLEYFGGIIILWRGRRGLPPDARRANAAHAHH